MSLPDLTAREHEVAAQECDTVAGYLEQLADLVDGKLAVPLARAHRTTALAVRSRAARHRERAAQRDAELFTRNAVTVRESDLDDRPGLSVPFPHR